MGSIKDLWYKYSRKKRWWTIVLDFLFVALLVAMLFPATRKPLSAFLIRQTLFSPSESDKVVYLSNQDWKMQMVNLDDQEVWLENFEGKPVFLNFWATWCPPCIAEMPSIQDLYDEYSEKVAFVLVTNEQESVVNAFMQKHGYTLPVYLLRSGVPAVFETSTIPSTYLISPGGRVLIQKTGAAKWDSRKMKTLLDGLLEK